MGAWGNGNFDDDSALDYISDVVGKHIAEIEEWLNADFGIEDMELLTASTEVIIALCQNCRAVPPEALAVEKWKQKALTVYDEEIDGLEPKPDYKIGRRIVIAETFDRLIKISNLYR